jgi:anti-sigma factor RsiW
MNACPEYELLLIDRAAGELADADRLQVERHLAECRACAAEAEAFVKVLSAVALPPRSAEERAALASLGRRTTGAWRRRERITSLLQGAAAGVIAAAVAATLIFVLPARRPAVIRPRTDPAVIALERWASPMPLGSELRENAIESLEPEFGEEESGR